MSPRSTKVDWLDYFAGGVPSGAFFKMRIDELGEIVDKAHPGCKTSVSGLAYIGLTAYFESFCKDHFGSIICIVPPIIRNLAAGGQDTNVDMALVTDSPAELKNRLGYYLSEKYDFGTAQKVNALFGALLTLTPFSKDEARIFDRILHDRNLLVHHGGTYTTSYLKAAAKRLSADEPQRAFWDGLRIEAFKFHEDSKFVASIAKKLLVSSHDALTRYSTEHGIVLGNERRKALNAFLWWE